MNISAADTLMRIFNLHRKTDPQTSRDAAARVHEFSGCHKAKILETLDKIGIGTAHEIAAASGLDMHAVNRRIKELETSGMIKCPVSDEDGKPLTRKTPSGRNARVWRNV